MRVRLETLGCRLNIGEIESLARDLVRAGNRVVGPGETADLCILNTCTVTATASRKSRHLLRQLRRSNPGAKLVVTGCYAELEPQAVRATGADLVVGNDNKDRLMEVLRERGLLEDGEPIPAGEAPLLPPGLRGRTRAFVKVQDGCDNRCTFCVVTLARGAGRSRQPEDVVHEIRRLVAAGFREAVLSGVHLGSYGHDLGDRQGLRHLVERVLSETRIERLRLSSLEPWDLDAGFFELFTDSRLLPHLHLPLQSGCDATLRRMARHTSSSDFAGLVRAARRAHPDMAVTTDVIVGFPGETEREFETSFKFIASMDLARLHIFRYSRRAGTLAARMPNQVPGPVLAERSRRMHELGDRLERKFMRRHLGRTMEVLWEDAEARGFGLRWSGLTGNYLRVVAESGPEPDLANRITSAVLETTIPGAVLATVPGLSPNPGFVAPRGAQRAS